MNRDDERQFDAQVTGPEMSAAQIKVVPCVALRGAGQEACKKLKTHNEVLKIKVHEMSDDSQDHVTIGGRKARLARHPLVKDTPPSIRERLEDILFEHMNRYRRASTSFEEREIVADARGAILAELKEPSEGVEAAMMKTGNAELLVMHTKEFSDKRLVQAGFDPAEDDIEARNSLRAAMHWGWRQGMQHIQDGGS